MEQTTKGGPNVNNPSDQDVRNTGGSLSNLNNMGKPLKANVNYGDAPLTQQNQPQPDINLMTGPEGMSGPLSLDKASTLYSVTKKQIAG